jgi:hypothetical protein
MPFTIRPRRAFLPLAYSSGFLSLITLLLASGGPVIAAWVSVHDKVKEGLTVYTVYVDPDTIRRNGDVVKLWALIDFKTLQTDPMSSYLSVKSQREIHCTEERIRLLMMTAFSGNMGSGTVVYRYSDFNDQGIPIERSSVAQSLWKVVCGKK